MVTTIVTPSNLLQGAILPLGKADRRIAAIIFRNPQVTQKEIVQMVEFTQQYVSKVINDLTASGVVLTGERLKKGRGQPGITLRINPEHAYSLGVAVMTDAISVALIDMAGNVRAENETQIEDPNLEDLTQYIEKNIAELSASTAINPRKISGIGIGLTGYFVGEDHKINTPPPLSKLALQDIERHLSVKFHIPVIVDNDGNTAAVAEAMMGVGKWARSFAYFYISAGFGGSIVIDGELYRGAYGNAGEFANIIPPDEPYPTLRTLKAIYDRNEKRFSSIDEMLEKISISDPEVDLWLDENMAQLNKFASAVSAVLDPEAIVFGGRLPKDLAKRMISGIHIFNSDRRHIPKPEPKLIPAEAPGHGTAIGAAMYPLLKMFY